MIEELNISAENRRFPSVSIVHKEGIFKNHPLLFTFMEAGSLPEGLKPTMLWSVN
jgi:hypothetical protein